MPCLFFFELIQKKLKSFPIPKIFSLFRNIITFNAMQNKFKNKYRISSVRLQTWDYSNNGAYFITICTQNREHFFGTIQNGIMQLSEIGKLAEQFWYEIPNNFPMVELGNFVVMPNHVHGILIIDNSQIPVETRFIASDNNDENNNIDKTRLIASLKGGNRWFFG